MLVLHYAGPSLASESRHSGWRGKETKAFAEETSLALLLWVLAPLRVFHHHPLRLHSHLLQHLTENLYEAWA
jgi:hypothetical protein